MNFRRRPMGLSAAFLVVAATLTLTGPVGIAADGGEKAETAAPGKRTLLISNCNKARFEPKQVILTCGDAGLIAQGLEWSNWTGKDADAEGTGVFETCIPNCATGGTVRAPIELDLSKPAKCKGGPRLFTKVRFTWPSGPPQGARNGSVPLGCKLLGGAR